MKKITVQIQSILYNNSIKDIERSLDSMVCAIELCQRNEQYNLVVQLFYGDSSSFPVLSDEKFLELSNKYSGFLKLNYLFFDSNTGTAKGHNILAKDCDSQYMLIMNPDVIFAPDVLSQLLSPFQMNKQVGMVEARQTPIEHPKDYDKFTGETSWATTACVIFPKSIFDALNGFDSDSFFMYYDDLDFSWRCRMLGYKVIYQPSAIIFHSKNLSNEGAWMPTSAEQYYSAEASLIMAYKWSNPERLKIILDMFKASDDDTLNRAAKEFETRKEKKLLPLPLDPDHKIAEFVGDFYTKHRFIL